MEIKEQKLTITGLRGYLNEWFNGTMSMGLLNDGNNETFNFVIVETTNQSVIYSCCFKNNEYKGEDETICSTAGIVNEELKGLVEQCIALDKQMAEYKAKEQNNNQPQNA